MDLIWLFLDDQIHIRHYTDEIHKALKNLVSFSDDYDTEHAKLMEVQTQHHVDPESEKVLLLVNQAHAAVAKAEKRLALRYVIVLLSLLSEGILVQLEE